MQSLNRSIGALWITAVLAACGGGESPADGSGLCPPTAAEGLDPGDVAPELSLPDCGGTARSLRDLCPRTAALLYTFAATCTTCQAYAASGAPNDLWQRYRDHDFAMWFIVTGDASNGPPDGSYCQVVAEQYDLAMPVLFDAAGVTGEVLTMPGNSGELVLTEGNLIASKTWGAPGTVERVLEDLYGF
ncbi:MAG: redoxin domain-containing protein [Deltaproteobacteria bacterium]|jgi:peroxiredoxin|nr:redoxin domain-containing protein [Deltaproteobacteria bacterium]MBW2530497.1 redoxin domain-containing protein [Deltaproteobacteria bacterium]